MKPDATKSEPPPPKPSGAERKRWPQLPHVRDVTAKQGGRLFAIVGAPPRRKV